VVGTLITADCGQVDFQSRRRGRLSDYRLACNARHLETRVKQRDFDALSATVTLTCYQGRDKAVSRDKGGIAGCERHSCINGLLALVEVAGEAWWIVKPGRGTDDTFPGANRRARIVLAKARNRAVDEPRVRCSHLDRAQAQALHGAGAEAFDYYVSRANQVLRDRGIRHTSQIEGDTAFAPLQDSVGGMLASRTTGRIDSNHVRAAVAQHHCGKRRGQVLTEIDYANSLEHGTHKRPSAAPMNMTLDRRSGVLLDTVSNTSAYTSRGGQIGPFCQELETRTTESRPRFEQRESDS